MRGRGRPPKKTAGSMDAPPQQNNPPVLDELIRIFQNVETGITKRIRQNNEYAMCLAGMFRLRAIQMEGEGGGDSKQKADASNLFFFFQRLLVGFMPPMPMAFSSLPATVEALLNSPSSWLPSEISSMALQGDPACTHLMVHGKFRHITNTEWDQSFYPLSVISEMSRQEKLDPIAVNFPIFGMMPSEDVSKLIWEILKSLLNPASRPGRQGPPEYHIQVSVVNKLFDRRQKPFLALLNIRCCILCHGTMVACCTSAVKLPKSVYVVEPPQGGAVQAVENQPMPDDKQTNSLWVMAKRQIEKLWYGEPQDQPQGQGLPQDPVNRPMKRARRQGMDPDMMYSDMMHASSTSDASLLASMPSNMQPGSAGMPAGLNPAVMQLPPHMHPMQDTSRGVPHMSAPSMSAQNPQMHPNPSMPYRQFKAEALPHHMPPNMAVMRGNEQLRPGMHGNDLAHARPGNHPLVIDQDEGLDLCKMIVNAQFSELDAFDVTAQQVQQVQQQAPQQTAPPPLSTTQADTQAQVMQAMNDPRGNNYAYPHGNPYAMP